ncbi:MAG: hypothetical protein E6J90_06600 [Deltaproteobacteria bacterium]|nr:MAG: hypothetical protein E6J91_21215 [Deltaproteobacteria bacterium]TMQ25111.1 MAG: hypothetical protein E6J90_06600 [Deltaproteobacteria bacterium]
MTRCSICYTVLSNEEPVTSCPECRQDYHTSCWTEIGGCGSYGCKQAAVAQKPPVPVLVGQGWGDSKTCPHCGQEIGASLLLCACGARFPWADPMTRDEYAAWVDKQAGIARSRSLLIVLFICSLLGFVALVTGPIAGVYAWLRRRRLAETGGTYLAMGYGSAAIGGVYALLIVLTALGH